MSLLTASELGAIQQLAEQGMDSLATILTRSVIETDDGQESVWATSGIDVPCWVYQQTPIGGTLGAVAGAVGISQTFSIRMPIGTAVESGDRIIVGTTDYLVEQTNSESTIAPWLVCGCRTLE
jgi:hypothetical protein